MKFLIDMNLSPLSSPFLAGHGYEGVHWSAIGDVSAPDSEILQYAAEHSRVVFTHDLDLGMLLAARKLLRPSVIQVRCQDVMPSAIGKTVVRAIAAASAHLKAGALVTVDPARHRIRLLPI
jgi:predicted nuclease of predicted toxin-antitoxin system